MLCYESWVMAVTLLGPRVRHPPHPGVVSTEAQAAAHSLGGERGGRRGTPPQWGFLQLSSMQMGLGEEFQCWWRYPRGGGQMLGLSPPTAWPSRAAKGDVWWCHALVPGGAQASLCGSHFTGARTPTQVKVHRSRLSSGLCRCQSAQTPSAARRDV